MVHNVIGERHPISTNNSSWIFPFAMYNVDIKILYAYISNVNNTVNNYVTTVKCNDVCLNDSDNL